MPHNTTNPGPAPEAEHHSALSKTLPDDFQGLLHPRVRSDVVLPGYRNDDSHAPKWGDDTASPGCVSAMRLEEMQFFGACVNLAKRMLYAINGR